MNMLNCFMEQAFACKHAKLERAKARNDTTGMWKMISSAIEDAFVKFLKLDGKDAQKMRGRGTPHFIKHTEDPGVPVEERHVTGAAALHRSANRHGTQASRLGHMAASVKKVVQNESSNADNEEKLAQHRKKQQI